MRPARALRLTQAWFDAARTVPGAGTGHPSARLHGHGFRVRALHGIDAGDAATSAAAEAALDPQGALLQAAARLDHRCLDDLLPVRDDEAIARWFAGQLPGAGAIGLRSRRGTGCELTCLPGPWGGDGATGAIASTAQGARVWRRFRFEAAHCLPNVPAGHKCGRMHGHGFELVIQADAQGDAVRAAAGIDAAWARLAPGLQGRCLNDIPGLENPTSEILCRYLRERLLPLVAGLGHVAVSETRSSGAVFDGGRYAIWKELSLDSAQRGPDGGLLGHTWLLRLHLSAPLDQVLGWTVDFGDVKQRFAPLFDALDHRPLYENPALQDGDTLSLARWVLAQGAARLPELCRVDLLETPEQGWVLGGDAAPFYLPV